MKWLLWSLVWLVGRLPFSLRGKLGSALGYLFSFVPTRDFRIGRLQLEKFLGTSESERILRRAYAHFGRTFLECLNVEPLIRNADSLIEFPDWPEAKRLLDQKKGIVALTAHLGNWDVLGAFFAHQKVPVIAVAKQARNPAVQFTLEKLRNSFGFQTLWRANKKGVLEIIESLKNAKVIAALIDQDTRVSSVPIPFFGVPASTPYTLIEVGKECDALFATAFVARQPNGRFQVRVKEIDSTLSKEDILTEYNKRLEAAVREFPEQWAWIHKRWRTTPQGERLRGSAYLNYLQALEAK